MLQKSKPTSALFLLVIYMGAIFSPLLINAMHEIDHVMEYFSHLYLEHDHTYDVQHTPVAYIHSEFREHGHSHGRFMDRVLRSVNDKDENEHDSDHALLANRIFDHLNRCEALWLVGPINKGSRWVTGHSNQANQTELSPETPPPKPYSIHTLTS